MSWQYAAQVVESYDGAMDAVDRAVTTVIGDVLALAGELAEHLREPGRDRGADRAGPRAPARAAAGAGAAHGRPLHGRRPTCCALLDARLGAAADGARLHGAQARAAARWTTATRWRSRPGSPATHPEVGEIERGRFGAVLLDEYQDTGEAQRVLLTSLFAGGHPVTAVGDPRQSIYGWRGASAGNLERFRADFAGDRDAGAGVPSRLKVELPQR